MTTNIEVKDEVVNVIVQDEQVLVDVVEDIVNLTIQENIDVTVVDDVTTVAVQSDEYLIEVRDAITIGEEDMARFAKEVDDQTDTGTGAGFIYIGEADPGTATSSALWRIKRIEVVIDVGGREDLSTLWADGNASFDNIWDDRLSLSYS